MSQVSTAPSPSELDGLRITGGGLEQRAFVCHHLEFDRAARMLGGQRLCCIGSPVEGGRERLEVGKMIRVKSFDLDKDRLDQFVPGEGAPRSEAVAV